VTDPVRGENPVWVANYKKKDRCLIADTTIIWEGVFRNPTSNQIVNRWAVGDKLSVDWVFTFNTNITCTQSSCTGSTSFLGPTCRDMFDSENDYEWTSPPGKTLGTAPYQFNLYMKYKIGCCSKKCASKNGKTSVNLNFTLPGNIYTARRNFTELDDGTGQEGRFGETDRSPNAITSIVPEVDDEFIHSMRDKATTAAGLNVNAQYSQKQHDLGGTNISYYVDIVPGGLFDQNFERPCGE